MMPRYKSFNRDRFYMYNEISECGKIGYGACFLSYLVIIVGCYQIERLICRWFSGYKIAEIENSWLFISINYHEQTIT